MNQEENIWSGTPSQIINIGTNILCVLFFWLVIPLFILWWKYLVVKNTKYELTSQRLRLRTGVLNKEVNELELYRVKDFKIEQPFLLRIFSVANIVLDTSDNSHPTISILAVENAESLLSMIREHVEVMRRNRVREVDLN